MYFELTIVNSIFSDFKTKNENRECVKETTTRKEQLTAEGHQLYLLMFLFRIRQKPLYFQKISKRVMRV